MKFSELQQTFTWYCNALNLKIDSSRHEGEGANRKYITAMPGTYQLRPADGRTGKKYAICKNGENGTFATIYGYHSAEHLQGYMDHAVTSARGEDLIKPAQPINEKILHWAKCLLADIEIGAIRYEDGSVYDPEYITRLKGDIAEAEASQK